MTPKSLPAGARPLRLQSAASGVMSFLQPTDAGNLPTIVLNIVASRDNFELPTVTTQPPIALSADGGVPVRVPVAPDAVDISNGTEDVASAGLTVEEPGIYQVVISVLEPVSIWEVRVTNPGEEPLNFTSTVATNENDARQPWIDLPPTVNFRTAVAGETTVAQYALATGVRKSSPSATSTWSQRLIRTTARTSIYRSRYRKLEMRIRSSSSRVTLRTINRSGGKAT